MVAVITGSSCSVPVFFAACWITGGAAEC